MNALLFLISCSQPEPAVPGQALREGPLAVRSASFPVSYLVDRLGGEGAENRCILPPGEDAQEWSPSPDEIAGLADADLIVANGAGFEGWIKTASLPDEKLVFAAQGIRLIEQEGRTHSHGKKGEHSHGEIDPRTWTDPKAYLQQARNVKEALVRNDSANRAYYHDRLAALESELDALGQELAGAAAPLKGLPLASSNPAFSYLARRYGLEVRAFSFDPELPPPGVQLAAFQSWSQDKGEVAMLWDQKPSAAVKASFPKEIRHVYLDPLEKPASGAYDYLVQARANIPRLVSIHSKDPDAAQ